MPRFTPIPDAAKKYERHPRTIENWIGAGLIRGYRDGKRILVDLDEIEAGFVNHPTKMRDGRRPFGKQAVIVPLPPPTHDDSSGPRPRRVVRVEAEPEPGAAR